MTDTDKLKRLAEAISHPNIKPDWFAQKFTPSGSGWNVVFGPWASAPIEDNRRRETMIPVGMAESLAEYIAAANPQATLALIAERDEAVALLREAADAALTLGEVAGDESADDIARKSFAFLARIDGGEG